MMNKENASLFSTVGGTMKRRFRSYMLSIVILAGGCLGTVIEKAASAEWTHEGMAGEGSHTLGFRVGPSFTTGYICCSCVFMLSDSKSLCTSAEVDES